MPRRASDLIVIPGSFWQRAQVVAALRDRDMGVFFALVSQYSGASQTQIAIACGTTQGKVSDIMRGVQKVRTLASFERIADGLDMPDQARIALGLAPRAMPHPAGQADRIQSRDTGTPLDAPTASGLLSIDLGGDEEDEDPVRRRTFVGLAGASMFGALLADAPSASAADDAGHLAPVLAGYMPDPRPGTVGGTADIGSLAKAVTTARRDYQACGYSGLVKCLPALLNRLHAACVTLDGDPRLRAYALSADAHHVAAGLLLKLGDRGLAYLAADRSMQAARASEDPITIGASARIVTHTLMSGHHFHAAVATARDHALRLDRDIAAHTPESLSVYGSLLLRGAIAASLGEQRSTAHELLAEADNAGRQLGADANLRGTAFGPLNARLHRVNIAVTLGDAGTAIDVARGIEMSKLSVTERKASLCIDTARAFLQWGKHDKAYMALRAAEEIAPEEVTGRPTVHRLVAELARTAPRSLKPDAQQFAHQLGVTW